MRNPFEHPLTPDEEIKILLGVMVGGIIVFVVGSFVRLAIWYWWHV